MELARCNGTVLIEQDGALGIVERGGGGLGTAIFIAVLLTVVLGAGGGMLVAVEPAVGASLLGVAALSAGLAVTLIRRKRRAATATTLPAPWLVFDLAARVVRDRSGATLGSLDQIHVARVFQAGSSSKALAVFCPSMIVIARGTPFGDEVDQVEHALRTRGIGQGQG